MKYQINSPKYSYEGSGFSYTRPERYDTEAEAEKVAKALRKYDRWAIVEECPAVGAE